MGPGCGESTPRCLLTEEWALIVDPGMNTYGPSAWGMKNISKTSETTFAQMSKSETARILFSSGQHALM